MWQSRPARHILALPCVQAFRSGDRAAFHFCTKLVMFGRISGACATLKGNYPSLSGPDAGTPLS